MKKSEEMIETSSLAVLKNTTRQWRVLSLEKHSLLPKDLQKNVLICEAYKN
jgi:hypothetical protein